MRFFIAIAIALLLSGCVGTPFNWNDARRLKPGMTTQEVKAIMGAPHTIKSEGDIVRYVWVEVSMLDYSSKTLAIDFRNNKAIKVPTIPDDF